jgi:hypothetical protein
MRRSNAIHNRPTLRKREAVGFDREGTRGSRSTERKGYRRGEKPQNDRERRQNGETENALIATPIIISEVKSS